MYSKDYREKWEESRDLWPFFSLKADKTRFEFQILNLAPKGFSAIDRNLSPLWKFYTYESKDDNYRSDLFWGLFQLCRYGDTRIVSVAPFYSYRRSGGEVEQSVLFHLLKWKRGPRGTVTRLFYFLEF